MNDMKKSACGDYLISRRRVLYCGLAGMASLAGGFWPLSAFGKTSLINGAKTGSRSTMRYHMRVDYESGTPFRCFFNNFLYADIPAFATAFHKFFCASFFIAGDNTVTLAWGPLPGEPDWDPNNIAEIAPPAMMISLNQFENYNSSESIIFEKKLSEKNLLTENGLTLPAYRITFDNPNPEVNFAPLFYETRRCNATEQDIQASLPRMREFCRKLYGALRAGNIELLAEASSIRLADDSLAVGEPLRQQAANYSAALKIISEAGLDYSVRDNSQFALLPTCEGRLWRICVMKTAEAGAEVMDKIAMHPHALPKFDYELFQSKRDEGIAVKLPSYLAEVEDEFRIVR